MHLLLSNDDGLDAEGLQLLRDTLRRACPDIRITTVAPDQEQSASSHSLTLTRPLRVQSSGNGLFGVSGTPTDCILLALNGLMKDDPPDVVISGINHGPNMGEDVHYSGTVAAAFEASLLGLPSIALSLASREKPLHFGAAQHFVAEILPRWLHEGLDRSTLLNVNIPATEPSEVQGIRLCALGSRRYEDVIVRKEDPRGRAYYWIGGADRYTFVVKPDTDFVLSAAGWITVTPLQVDVTDHAGLGKLDHLGEDWS